jgi:Ca2+-binding EF-hand superfamily protein
MNFSIKDWSLAIQSRWVVSSRGKDPDTLQDVIDALKVFDTDHDSKISTEKFLYAMTNMGELMT